MDCPSKGGLLSGPTVIGVGHWNRDFNGDIPWTSWRLPEKGCSCQARREVVCAEVMRRCWLEEIPSILLQRHAARRKEGELTRDLLVTRNKWWTSEILHCHSYGRPRNGIRSQSVRTSSLEPRPDGDVPWNSSRLPVLGMSLSGTPWRPIGRTAHHVNAAASTRRFIFWNRTGCRKTFRGYEGEAKMKTAERNFFAR